MREIVLDTETTGLDPKDGHRVIEIGCVELINYLPTGRVYHAYINPERDVPAEASAISGLKTEFLATFPIFAQITDDFLAFIGDDKLVIHNAPFDLKFLNAELKLLGQPALPLHRAIDTLLIARNKFPGSPASLDALCRRFEIDLSTRTKHGALVDSGLLAKVYLELVGGRQTTFSFGITQNTGTDKQSKETAATRPLRPARPHHPLKEELAAHQELIAKIQNNLWAKLT
jgi:DNA polymerase-3 subunit epsilon